MKNTKKLLAAAIMLVVAFTAVVSSTYAWFTLNNPVLVEDVTVDVGSGDGIYISADGTNWKTTLKMKDITDVEANNLINGVSKKYSPVCCSTLSDFATTQTFNMLSGMNNGTATFKTAVAGTDYSMFKLYFKAEQGKKIDLSGINLSVQSEGVTNYAALSMLRIAIVANGQVKGFRAFNDSISGIEVAVNPYFTTNSASATTTTTGETQYTSQYDKTNFENNTSSLGTVLKNDNGVIKIKTDGYAGYKAAHDTIFAGAKKTEGDGYNNVNTSFNSMLALEANTPQSITVFVWLDGWDSLCINDLANTKIKFNFTFTPNTSN